MGVARHRSTGSRKALSVRVSHRFTASSARFDEDNLVSHAGLVPLLGLAEQTRLPQILAEKVSITTARIKSGAANPAPKVSGVIDGMCTGAASIDDLDMLRDDAHPVRRDLRALHLRDAVAGVQLRPRPPAGVGAAPTPDRVDRTNRAAGRDRRSGVRRHRLAAAPGVRTHQAGRLLRPHQNRR